MNTSITFLGTGTSQGVPIINCDCKVCTSSNIRDKRTRTSAVITIDNTSILIDATPELRIQCLANKIKRVDSCLLTHTHADHLMGLDDLRRFTQSQKMAMDILASQKHINDVKTIFGYASADIAKDNNDLPKFNFRSFDPERGPFNVSGQMVQAFYLDHGPNAISVGFRIGEIAYFTDLKGISKEIIMQLQGLKLIVLGALRTRPHKTHLSLQEAVLLAESINAEKCYLVHMSHNMGHDEINDNLPEGISLAYDGLTVAID